MKSRFLKLSGGLLASLALAPLFAAACTSPDPDPTTGAPDDAIDPDEEDGDSDVAEAQSAIAISRYVPIRFIEPLTCKPGTAGCATQTTYTVLRQSVDRANEIFAAQGIKFWIKSVERYHLPKFAHKDAAIYNWSQVKSGPAGTTEDGLRTVFPAMSSSSYDNTQDAKLMKQWITSTTAFFGDPDELAIWLTDDGTAGAQSEGWYPEHGRQVLMVAQTMGVPADGYATTSLAHEIGHFFGVRHPWEAVSGRNPATGNDWTTADQWDLVYCLPTPTEFTSFFQSKAHFLSVDCPEERTWRILTGNNCYGNDPYGVVSCFLNAEIYSTGDPQVDHLLWVDPNVVHNPPSSIKYGINVMDYYGNSGRDLRVPSRFSESQLYQISQYKDHDVMYDASDIVAISRSDGAFPTNGIATGVFGLRPMLGTSTEDFIWWANGADLSFKSQTRPIGGTNYSPVSGDFNNDGFDDILWYNPATGGAYIWTSLGAAKDFTASPLLNFGAGFTVLSGNFDGVNGDDLFFFGPSLDKIYWANGNGTFAAPQSQNLPNGTTPIAGNFDGQGGDDIFWYNPTTGYTNIWWAVGATKTFTQVNNLFVGTGLTPVAGNFDGLLGTDIFWYGPGALADQIWFSNIDKTFDKRGAVVGSLYTPVAGDFDGDGADDIFWDMENSPNDALWKAVWNRNAPFQSTPASVHGAFKPIPGKFDGTWQGRNATDIFWYRK